MTNQDTERGDFEGGCLCGSVRYAVSGSLRDVVACHCVQCRKTTGHFMAATRAETANFTLKETVGLAWYHASDTARRGFFKVCGATLILASSR